MNKNKRTGSDLEYSDRRLGSDRLINWKARALRMDWDTWFIDTLLSFIKQQTVNEVTHFFSNHKKHLYKLTSSSVKPTFTFFSKSGMKLAILRTHANLIFQKESLITYFPTKSQKVNGVLFHFDKSCDDVSCIYITELSLSLVSTVPLV